jgi:hypothetical protein
VLRLHGERPPGDNIATATRVGALGGFDPAPFVRAVRHVRGEARLTTTESSQVLGGYVAAIEHLSRHLDRFAPA